MRQAIHIFRKDARFLRVEILLLLMLAAMLAWTETHAHIAGVVVELLVILAINYTIARVVHAEAIPGHNQFWITRPYRWKSLLGAKILFIIAFVNLPLLAAQCYMILAENFSFGESLPGLIWSQVLTIVCISLPAMCIASLTASLVPFLLAEFLLVGAVLITEGVHLQAQRPTFFSIMQSGPPAVDWVRDSVALIVMAGVTAYVLRSQYKTRRTRFGDRCLIGGGVAAAVLFLCVPWPFAMGVQSILSASAFDAASLSVSLGPVTKSVIPPSGRGGRQPAGQISLPFVVKGLRDGRDLEADALAVTLTASDGRKWESRFINPIMIDSDNPDTHADSHAEAVIGGILHVDPVFFEAESTRPVTLTARLYLTLFGDPHSITIPIQPEPVRAIDGLLCQSGLFNQLHCMSIFRWPRRRVYAMTGEGGVESFIRDISYSPFPATFGFDPLEQHSFSGAQSASQATIITKTPLSHFHVDADISGVMLAGYTAEAKRKAMVVPPPGVH